MTLDEIGVKCKTDKSSLFHNYLSFYERMLPDRDFSGCLLEIGVMDGASLRMWREYYPEAKIIGLDIDRKEPIKGCEVWCCDATNWPQMLAAGVDLHTYGVIVDDGSHSTFDQQRTLELLWPFLEAGGVYVMEDLHTSFRESHVDSERTTVEVLMGEGGWTFFGDPKESYTAVKIK